MAKKQEEVQRHYFGCDLELAEIRKTFVRYRVKNPSGFTSNLAHIEFDRKGFPADEDFSLSFINADLSGLENEQAFRKGGGSDKAKSDRIKAVREKQELFRKFASLKLVVSEV